MTKDNYQPANIEIRLQTVSQLFNSLDPSPFYSRDLDNDAEEFIVGWAAELPKNEAIRIILHVPQDEVWAAERAGQSGYIAQYFGDRADHHERQMRDLFRIGFRHLGVGLSVLTACLLLSQLVSSIVPSASIARIVEESLIIVGWVANWKPIEIFLYDWWPASQKIKLYRRLQAADVEIDVYVPSSSDAC